MERFHPVHFSRGRTAYSACSTAPVPASARDRQSRAAWAMGIVPGGEFCWMLLSCVSAREQIQSFSGSVNLQKHGERSFSDQNTLEYITKYLSPSKICLNSQL